MRKSFSGGLGFPVTIGQQAIDGSFEGFLVFENTDVKEGASIRVLFDAVMEVNHVLCLADVMLDVECFHVGILTQGQLKVKDKVQDSLEWWQPGREAGPGPRWPR